jgi:hypothetical protein
VEKWLVQTEDLMREALKDQTLQAFAAYSVVANNIFCSEDILGFDYSQVKEEQVKECGKCSHVCPGQYPA